VSKPKLVLPWPQPGEPWRYVSDPEACARGGFSLSHLARIPDAPQAVVFGPRVKRRRSDDWDRWFASRPKAKPAPIEQPAPVEQPKRRRGRPSKAKANVLHPE
jgi:hypothetical protein